MLLSNAGSRETRVRALTGVSQAEGPEPQVRGRVRDAPQTILDGVNGLVHEHVRCIKLLTNNGRWKDRKQKLRGYQKWQIRGTCPNVLPNLYDFVCL